MELLQEILHQQEVLRQQQQQLDLHFVQPQAQPHPPPQPQLPAPAPGPDEVVQEADGAVDGPPVQLNGFQAWQVNWQQAQQQQRQHMQPFLAEVPAPPCPVRPPPVLPPPSGAIKSWEQENEAERSKRHAKYRKMAEATGSNKRSIQQQASAMAGSVLSLISFLRSLDVPLGDDDQAKSLAEMIGTVQSARQELVAHFEFLEVAHDFE